MKLIRKLGTRLDKNGKKQSWAIFECPFDNKEVEMRLGNGRKALSCKDHKSIKHNGSYTELYKKWGRMKQRILNPNSKSYKDYGGRGITICDEWLEFIPFRDWALTNGYSEDLEINRIKNDGNYEPFNCDFVTSTENNRNKRGQKIKDMEMADEIRYLYATNKYTMLDLSKKYNASVTTIFNIINNKRWIKE